MEPKSECPSMREILLSFKASSDTLIKSSQASLSQFHDSIPWIMKEPELIVCRFMELEEVVLGKVEPDRQCSQNILFHGAKHLGKNF